MSIKLKLTYRTPVGLWRRFFFFFYVRRAVSSKNTALLSLGELCNVMVMFLKWLLRVLQLKILNALWKWVFDTGANQMKTLNIFYLVIYWTQKVHNDFIFLCSLHSHTHSFTVTCRFSFTMASTAAMASGVTTRCAWPGRGDSVTELMPFMNFLVHSYTCCIDRHASPYWTFIRRWISTGVTPSLRKKTDDRTRIFFGARCKRGRHLYTTAAPSCCIPAS